MGLTSKVSVPPSLVFTFISKYGFSTFLVWLVESATSTLHLVEAKGHTHNTQLRLVDEVCERERGEGRASARRSETERGALGFAHLSEVSLG